MPTGLTENLVPLRPFQPTAADRPKRASKGYIDTFLDGLGVRLLSVWHRRRGAQSHARGTMREILRDHGQAHLSLIVRFITESGENKGALWSETVGAMSDVLQ